MQAPQRPEEQLHRKNLNPHYAARAKAAAEEQIRRNRLAKDAKVYGWIGTAFFIAGTIAAVVSKNMTYTGRGFSPAAR